MMEIMVRRVRSRGSRTRNAGPLAARYDRLAATWSRRIRRLGFIRAYRAVFARLADQVYASGPGIRIADLGIGSGDAALSLVQALPVNGVEEVVGVDTSDGMLAVAGQRLAAAGIPHRLLHADLCALPIASASCDAAIAAHSIEHLDNPAPALDEVDRVLRPGGIAIFVMTRCSLPSLTLEAMWPISCVRSDLLRRILEARSYRDVQVVAFPWAIVPNLLSFVCVARKEERGAADAAPRLIS